MNKISLLSAALCCLVCVYLCCASAQAQGYGGQGGYGTAGNGNKGGVYAASATTSCVGAKTAPITVAQWFQNYDQIRRTAQMSLAERKEADSMLAMGMACLVPGDTKDKAQVILQKMVSRYALATKQMRALPLIKQTEALHRGFYQYFGTAELLFTDYLKVQNDLFAADPKTSQPIATELFNRKAELEQINTKIQELDKQTRAQFNIAPYRYF